MNIGLPLCNTDHTKYKGMGKTKRKNVMVGGRVFFTSDHHFGHFNITKYQNRPFNSSKEMDEFLIEKWNSVVSSEDIVFHLGDFTLRGLKFADMIWRRLNGNIKMVAPPYHHDRKWIEEYRIGDGSIPCESKSGLLVDLYEGPHVLQTIEGFHPHIVLYHFPFAVWDRKHYGSWHLHGHSHGRFKGEGLCMDVGVDTEIANYCPVSLEQVRDFMENTKKEFLESITLAKVE